MKETTFKRIKAFNTALLMNVATYMATKGVIDISYNELKEIIETAESQILSKVKQKSTQEETQ